MQLIILYHKYPIKTIIYFSPYFLKIKVELSIVAPGHHVQRPLGGIEARQTRHGDLEGRPNRIFSLTI